MFIKKNRLLDKRIIEFVCKTRSIDFLKSDLPRPSANSVGRSLSKAFFIEKDYFPKGIGWLVRDNLYENVCWLVIEAVDSKIFEQVLTNLEGVCRKNDLCGIRIRRTKRFEYEDTLKNNHYKVQKDMMRLSQWGLGEEEIRIEGIVIKNPSFEELNDYFRLETKVFRINTEVRKTYWNRLFKEQYERNPYRFWVAIATGKVVAGVRTISYDWYQDRKTDVICGLCVAPKHRRRGLGTTLLKKAIAYSGEDGRDIEMVVDIGNCPVRALGKKSGFEVVKRDWAKSI